VIPRDAKLVAVGNRDELRKQSGRSGQLEEIFLSLTAGGEVKDCRETDW